MGSLYHNGTLRQFGSHSLIGTLLKLGSLSHFGTLSCFGSLESPGTPGVCGSLQPSVLNLNGSHVECGTHEHNGSLFGNGTLVLPWFTCLSRYSRTTMVHFA